MPGCSTARSRPNWRWRRGGSATCTWRAAKLQVNGQALAAGDAALLRGESQVELAQGRDADVLVFDLAAVNRYDRACMPGGSVSVRRRAGVG